MAGKHVEHRSAARKTGNLTDKSARMKIRYRGLTETTMRAVIVDISYLGIGIISPEPLSPGQLVNFVGVDSSLDIPDHGIVMWSICKGKDCRAGLRFEDTSAAV